MGCVKGPLVSRVAVNAEIEVTGLVTVEVAGIFLADRVCLHVSFPPAFVSEVLAATEEYNSSTTEVKCS